MNSYKSQRFFFRFRRVGGLEVPNRVLVDTLEMTHIAIENGPVDIVSFPCYQTVMIHGDVNVYIPFKMVIVRTDVNIYQRLSYDLPSNPIKVREDLKLLKDAYREAARETHPSVAWMAWQPRENTGNYLIISVNVNPG